MERNWIYYWLERVEEMSALVEKVRRVVETHGTPRQRTRFFMTLVLMLYRRDRYQVSTEMLEYGRQAVEASEACAEESEQAMPRFIHAFGLVLHGDLDEAEQESEIGLRLAERMGDMALQCRLLTYLTLVYRRRGQVDRTREYGEHTLRVATATRMDDYVGAAHASRAWVALREQRWEEAEQEARTALECWRKLSAVYPYPLQWQGLWVLVVTALRRRALAERWSLSVRCWAPRSACPRRCPPSASGARCLEPGAARGGMSVFGTGHRVCPPVAVPLSTG